MWTTCGICRRIPQPPKTLLVGKPRCLRYLPAYICIMHFEMFGHFWWTYHFSNAILMASAWTKVYKGSFWMIHHGSKSPKRTTVWSLRKALVTGLVGAPNMNCTCIIVHPCILDLFRNFTWVCLRTKESWRRRPKKKTYIEEHPSGSHFKLMSHCAVPNNHFKISNVLTLVGSCFDPQPQIAAQSVNHSPGFSHHRNIWNDQRMACVCIYMFA